MRLIPTIAPDIPERLRNGIERANRILEVEVLERARGPVRAGWTLGLDVEGTPSLRLRLTDFIDTVEEAQFAPEDFEDEDWLSIRLIRLWGDLLQKRSDRLLEPLLAPVGSQEGR